MLCPSCGKSVGETLRLCDECAEFKRQRDEQEAAERMAREEALRQSQQECPTPEEQGDAGVDDTQLLLVKAIGAAIIVLIILLLLLLLFS